MEHSTGYAIRQFLDSDTEAAVALWEACELTRPWNDPRADIARSLGAQPKLFLAATTTGSSGSPDSTDSSDSSVTVIGTVMGGYDGHRGWMYYLATSPEHRGLGIGRALVHEIERRLEAIGCPKAQLMVRADNAVAVGFYTELGYETNDVLVLGKRLVEDAPQP